MRQWRRTSCSQSLVAHHAAIVALFVAAIADATYLSGAAFTIAAISRQGIFHGCRRALLRRAASGDTDFHGLNVQELRALLKERGLVRKGRKEDLIQRLQRHDAGLLDSEDAQAAGGMASTATDGRAVGAIRPGDTVYLRAHTGRHLEVELDQVMARWDDHGDWQAFCIEKSPLVIENTDENVFQSGDMVFLKAHTGHFVDIDGEDVRARWADQNHGMKWQGLVIVKHGSGAILPGDTVFLQAGSGCYLDVQGDRVRARWEDEGEWQALVLEK